jgi:uncharacterized membrane protein
MRINPRLFQDGSPSEFMVEPSDPISDPDTGVPAEVTGTPSRHRVTFLDDFRRFFQRGLAALMPTLITMWLLVWAWEFLWNNVGQHVIWFIRWCQWELGQRGVLQDTPGALIYRNLPDEAFTTRLLGVALAILLVYIVGVFVGNLLGRTAWRLIEHAVMRIPLIRAIYPAVKQVTDFLLSERTAQFQGSAVVAVEPHAKGIWSIGLVTGRGLGPLSQETGQEMVTVFVPSSPTAFSGYVLVVPRESVIELPLKVEEAMRLLVSGGVIVPDGDRPGKTKMRTMPINLGEKISAE